MSFQELNGLKLYKFDSLTTPGCQNAVFTRHGGTSLDPWASLNLGGTVGDDPQHVLENRKRAFDAIGRRVEDAYDVWQVHSDRILYSDKPRGDVAHEKADAIITDRPGVILFMRFGDCVPILLTDPQKGIIAMVHAGWLGTVQRIVSKTVTEMVNKFHCHPENIRAGIGPSICVDHYQIGHEVVERVRHDLPEFAEKVLIQKEDAIHLDLWKTNELLLNSVGVGQVEQSGLCTAGNTGDWYSHRAEKGRTGRFGAVLFLE